MGATSDCERKTRASRLALAAGALMTVLTAAPTVGMAGPTDPAPIVQTAGGPVQAAVRPGRLVYFAIPYAAAPVGDRRWRPPVPAPAWTTPIARTTSAPACIQSGRSPFAATSQSEDCLYLDVHVPAGHGPFPVMVWIHGGAFTTGGVATYNDPFCNRIAAVNPAFRDRAFGHQANCECPVPGGHREAVRDR